jgi:hypothetical protein
MFFLIYPGSNFELRIKKNYTKPKIMNIDITSFYVINGIRNISKRSALYAILFVELTSGGSIIYISWLAFLGTSHCKH